MDKETMNKVFDWLEREVNGKGYYEFVLEDRNQITAYWKGSHDRFAQFYIRPIIEILENNEEDKPIIEKIGSNANNTLFIMECYTGIPEQAQDWNFKVLENKINELTDAVNKLTK